MIRALQQLLVTLQLSDPCVLEPRPTFELSERVLVSDGLRFGLRASRTLTGAGPNRWTAAPHAAWADGQGLHLRLSDSPEGWMAVEAIAELPARPRRLEFTTEVPGGLGGDSVVAGVFLYRSDRCEIDMELSRWGDPAAVAAQYAVAPADAPGLVHRFPLDPATPARHTLRWRGRCVRWQTAVEGAVVADWRLCGVPRFAQHRLHVNLWMIGAQPPDQPVELVVSGLVVNRGRYSTSTR